MVLGKNMKVDRLIPLKKEDKALEATPPVAQEEITPAVSVSLDEFFDNLTSEEPVKAPEVTQESVEVLQVETPESQESTNT